MERVSRVSQRGSQLQELVDEDIHSRSNQNYVLSAFSGYF